MKTLIFDSNAACLQWTSNREIFLEALKEFVTALGIDPHNRDLNPADWTFYRMTDEKEKELAAGDMVTHYRVIQAAAGSASAILAALDLKQGSKLRLPPPPAYASPISSALAYS